MVFSSGDYALSLVTPPVAKPSSPSRSSRNDLSVSVTFVWTVVFQAFWWSCYSSVAIVVRMTSGLEIVATSSGFNNPTACFIYKRLWYLDRNFNHNISTTIFYYIVDNYFSIKSSCFFGGVAHFFVTIGVLMSDTIMGPWRPSSKMLLADWIRYCMLTVKSMGYSDCRVLPVYIYLLYPLWNIAMWFK